METLSTSAKLFDHNGMLKGVGLTVHKRTESKYSELEPVLIVGSNVYNLSDIDDSDDGILSSLVSGWYVIL